MKGYLDLPKIPPKSFLPVRKLENLEWRRKEFDTYIAALIKRSDTRNDKKVIEFLELDQFAPELLIKKPKLIELLDCGADF